MEFQFSYLVGVVLVLPGPCLRFSSNQKKGAPWSLVFPVPVGVKGVPHLRLIKKSSDELSGKGS